MSDVRMKLGAMIRAERKKKGLSQAKLAEKVDISAKYLGEVERGEGNITVSKLDRIAVVLKVRLGHLLDNSHMDDPDLLRTELDALIRKATKKEISMIYKTLKSLPIKSKW